MVYIKQIVPHKNVGLTTLYNCYAAGKKKKVENHENL